MGFPVRLLRYLQTPALLFGLLACVDAFTPNIRPNTDLLVVEGLITDLDEPQEIRLSRTRSTPDSTRSRPITGAQVVVHANDRPIALRETEPGLYRFPADFRGRVGERYQLRFTTADNVTYESNVETMVPVAPIERIYDRFNPEGIRNPVNGRVIPSNDIYVDFQDPAGRRDFYMWRWTLYEYQDWCATCRAGLYILRDLGDRQAGSCQPDPRVGSLTEYDYVCLGLCWDIFYNPGVNIFADQFSNGRPQTGRLVGQIPLQQSNPCLVNVEQQSLTVGAYRYYRLFQEQTQNTGTLADSPPAPLAGNVRNLADDAENVVGYFSASSVSINRYWLDRLNTRGGRFNGLFYFQRGRFPNVEPRGVFRTDVPPTLPSALCVPSRTRTNLFPKGWR